MIRAIGFMAASIFIGLTGCTAGSGSQHVSRLENKPAPDFELAALDGGRVRLSELRGKPVLVSFFAYG